MVQTDVYTSHKVLITLPATYEIGFGIGSLVILRPLISYPMHNAHNDITVVIYMEVTVVLL